MAFAFAAQGRVSMKRLAQWGAAVAVLAIAAGGCGKDNKSTRDTSKQADLNKSVGKGEGMFGAIFTTDSSGTVVNGNIYESKEDVYLNGGPHKPGAAGLPDGTYYYLITDPGCKEQLAGPSADDPYNTTGKTIEVVDGEFTDLMQLAPFADTPNEGGEYKVHVTSIEHYDLDAKNSCFGFVPRWTKTDNYKVRAKKPPHEETFCISGKKCFDRNGNGVCDSQEGPVADITIALSRVEEVSFAREEMKTQTSALGAWSFCDLKPGDYHVREILPELGSWEQTLPADGKGIDVTITDHDIENLLFGNRCFVNDVVPANPEDCYPVSVTN